MDNREQIIREGDLHSVIVVDGIEFEIRYGYYADYERQNWEPEPVFPDLKSNPVYTAAGIPIVTQMQDVCEHFELDAMCDNDGRCADCIHFYSKDNELIGICKCNKNNKKQ